MVKNRKRQPTQSMNSLTSTRARDDCENQKDFRVSPASKHILEEIIVKRKNVMRELANR